MPQVHEVYGRPDDFAVSLPDAAEPSGDAQQMVAGSGAEAAAAGELSRLAHQLGLGAYAHSTEALKSELQKIVLALHPDKSGGEFKSDADKARFMKARLAIGLLSSDSAAEATRESTALAGAPRAITDASRPVNSAENEHRMQVRLLARARVRIAQYFAVPKIASTVLASVLLVVLLMADRFERHPLLGPLFDESAAMVLLAVLACASAAAAGALWLLERAAARHAEHLLSESALGELFEEARRSASRQGRIGQLSGFDLRRGIDVLADGGAAHRMPGRALLRRSLDATTRESITLLQTKRLMARRVIRVVERPAIEVLYEVSPRATRETFG